MTDEFVVPWGSKPLKFVIVEFTDTPFHLLNAGLAILGLNPLDRGLLEEFLATAHGAEVGQLLVGIITTYRLDDRGEYELITLNKGMPTVPVRRGSQKAPAVINVLAIDPC